MKDECAGTPIAEFVGLRPKMYSILTAAGAEACKAKEVKKCVVKKHIRHEQNKEAFFQGKTFHHGMDMVRSQGNQICGLHLNKVPLSPLDTKTSVSTGTSCTSARTNARSRAGIK